MTKKLFGFVLLAISSLAFGQKANVQSVNNIRYTDAYQWRAKPTDDLSTPGTSKTITLPAKILGIDVSLSATKVYYVYIYDVGTAEAARVTGGTYTSAAGGTVIVTTVNAHTAGYSVGSASSGIQEALNDAGTPMARVIIPPSKGMGPVANAWPVYAPIVVQNNQMTLEGDGAALNCFTRTRCILFGSLASATTFSGMTIRNLRFGSSVANSSVAITNTECSSNTATITTGTAHTFVTGDVVDVQWTLDSRYWGGNVGANNGITVTDSTHFTFPKTGCSIGTAASQGFAALENAAIEDNIQALNMENLFFSTPGGITQKFSNLIVIDNDQAAKIIGLNVVSGPIGGGTPNAYTGNVVYAPGPFSTNAAVIYIDKANIGLQCSGNGINNLGGNTLAVSDSVVQGFQQFGITTGNLRGGFGPSTITNVYQEVGTCSNNFYPGSGTQVRGMAGVFNYGTFVSIRGGEAPLGQIPKFAATGNNGRQYNYYVVVKDSTQGTSSALPFGYATVDSVTPTGSITLSWPRVQGTATVTYDVIRTSGTQITTPYNGGCLGTTTTACGSIATAVAQCSTILCSVTDDASLATTAYTVTNQNYYPKLNFWPGALVLTPIADGKTDSSTFTAYIEGTEFTTFQSPIVSVFGTVVPSITAARCEVSTPGVWVTCLTGNSSGAANPAVIGTLFQNGPANSGAITANLKGRLNILNNPGITVNSGDLLTLVDSAPEKTLNSPYYRPALDANDTAIGLDVVGATVKASARLAFRAPLSQSWYLASSPDGTSWKMRLDTTALSLKTDLTTTGSITMTGGAGTLNAAASLKSIPWIVANGVPNNAACTIDGQAYFQSDSVNLGQQLWFCKTNVWTLMSGGGGGGGTWNTISSPGGNQSLSMGNFSSTWTGGTALTNPILTITDTAGDTYTGNLMQVTVPATSTALGLGVTVPTGGTAATFSAGANGFAIKVPSGQGNIQFNRLISTSVNTPTSGCSICTGSTDMMVYWNGSLAQAMTMIQGGGAGPVHVGDTPGIDLAGTLTTRTAGQGLSIVPKANTVNGDGGDLTLTAGAGAGTGKNGIVRLSGGSGGTGGKGLVSLGTSGAGSSWTNDNTNPPTQYGPVCVTSAGIAQQCGAGALEGLVGICMDNCTSTGSSVVVSNQWARGTFDGATVTSGDYVSASATPGLLTDVGPSPTTTAMTIGIVGSNISATDWNVFVFPQSPVANIANVVVTNPAGGNVILSASPTQVPLTLQTAATGTADIFLVKKGDGTTALKVDTNGILTVGTGAGTITTTQILSGSASPIASNGVSDGVNNVLRMANVLDKVAWRNSGNSADLEMGVNNSNFLALDRMPGITINPNHGSFATTLAVPAPGQNQTLTIPDVGAATGTFVLQDFTQTLSKKTISDAVTFTNIATPPAPAAGFLKLYAKANQICTETSAAVEACGAGGGGATVTSVGQTINGGAASGIFTLSGGPVTTAGTLDTAIAGTSGGVPYFSSGTVISSSAALTSNSPVLGGGAGATPKTIAGLTTDGTSVMTFGVAGSVVGGIDLKNATSGTISIRPTTGALGAVTWTVPASTDTAVGKATTDILTNKTFDADAGTGNVLVSSSKIYIAAAGCQNTTPQLLWDTPTTNPAVAACDTGTNVQKGIANFADGANTLSMSTNFLLPSDWSGAIDAKFRWFTTATAGNIVWQIATICVADGETSDPAYNTASTVTDAAKGTTLQDNDATITGITTTGCAAGEMMYVKVFRDPANGSDTLAATGSLRGVELTLRRTQ